MASETEMRLARTQAVADRMSQIVKYLIIQNGGRLTIPTNVAELIEPYALVNFHLVQDGTEYYCETKEAQAAAIEFRYQQARDGWRTVFHADGSCAFVPPDEVAKYKDASKYMDAALAAGGIGPGPFKL